MRRWIPRGLRPFLHLRRASRSMRQPSSPPHQRRPGTATRRGDACETGPCRPDGYTPPLRRDAIVAEPPTPTPLHGLSEGRPLSIPTDYRSFQKEPRHSDFAPPSEQASRPRLPNARQDRGETSLRLPIAGRTRIAARLPVVDQRACRGSAWKQVRKRKALRSRYGRRKLRAPARPIAWLRWATACARSETRHLPVHATGAPHSLFAPQVWTALPEHCVAPTGHSPTQAPLAHTWLGQAVGPAHWPAGEHVCTPPSTH